FIRGYEDVNGKKRNGIIEFSKIYRIDKEKIAFIGDQPKDIIEAKAAGVISIAVSYGIGKKEILEKENPYYIVDSPTDLWDVILKIFKL
ncbi:MAG: HAD hydrolase-like protein, partial [Thermoplasmata archaeon]